MQPTPAPNDRAQLEMTLPAVQPHPTSARLKAMEAALQAGQVIDTTYMHRAFCLANLPVKRPQVPTSDFTRTGPGCTLQIKTFDFLDPHVHIGVPFGARARLLLLWMGNSVKRDPSSAHLEIGVVKEWLKEIGISSSGDGINETKEQLIKLARSAFAADIRMVRDGQGKVSFRNSTLIEEGCFSDEDLIAFGKGDLTSVKLPDGLRLTAGAHQELGSEYMVPLPMSVVRPISRSVTALDIVQYLSYRIPLIPERGREHLSFKHMNMMFGSSKTYSGNPGMYAKTIKAALTTALAAIPHSKEFVEIAVDDRGQPGLWLSHNDLSALHEKFVTDAKVLRRGRVREIKTSCRREFIHSDEGTAMT